MKRSASSSPALGLPKGPTRKSLKRGKRAHETNVKGHTRTRLWALTMVCAICGDNEPVSKAKQRGRGHEMHEDPSRAKTRGKPPEERFNLRVSMRLCYQCHLGYTAGQVRCVALDPQVGWRGPYEVQRKEHGEWVTMFRVER